MTVLYALTNALIAVVAWVVSGLTFTVTGAPFGEADPRFNVTPLITLLTVLLALLMGTLSTLSTAFRPVAAFVKLRPLYAARYCEVSRRARTRADQSQPRPCRVLNHAGIDPNVLAINARRECTERVVRRIHRDRRRCIAPHLNLEAPRGKCAVRRYIAVVRGRGRQRRHHDAVRTRRSHP